MLRATCKACGSICLENARGEYICVNGGKHPIWVQNEEQAEAVRAITNTPVVVDPIMVEKRERGEMVSVVWLVAEEQAKALRPITNIPVVVDPTIE